MDRYGFRIIDAVRGNDQFVAADAVSDGVVIGTQDQMTPDYIAGLVRCLVIALAIETWCWWHVIVAPLD